MRVLFTGATGVLGRAAIPLLVGDGHEVSGVARGDDGREWLAEVGARPVEVDLFDPESIRAAVTGMEAVVHYATSIPPQKSMTKRSAWETNDRLRSEATRKLVEAAIGAGVPRFIQESVTFFYADGGEDWLDEASPIDPVWEVLESALDAERNVDRFREAGGVGVTLRMSRLYGPGSASADYITSVRERKLPLVGDGQNFISSLHTHDAATATVAAMSAPDGTYNVSDDEPQKSGDHLRSLASLLDAPEPRRVPVWLARTFSGQAVTFLTRSQRVDNGAYKSATGWEPAYSSSEDGWARIVGDDQ